MTEAGIDASATRDLFVALGEPLDQGAWSVRLQVKPFIRWIWYGCLLMGLGGLLAACDKRYRTKRIATEHVKSDTVAANKIKPDGKKFGETATQ